MPTVQSDSNTGTPTSANVEYKDVNISYKGNMNAVAERVLLTFNEDEQYLVKVLLAQSRYNYKKKFF